MTDSKKTLAAINATNTRNAARFSWRHSDLTGFILQAENGDTLTPSGDETVVALNKAEALELAQALLAYVAGKE